MPEIPFLDLNAQYETIRGEIATAIREVLDSSAFVGGPFVEKFERDFAAFCGCSCGVGVSSGTSALWMTLMALGIGPGDEVITVPNSFIATAEAISMCGARPVFVDVLEETLNMNPALLEGALTARTKAVIPVHLYGQPADMDPILEFAGRHNLHVVEDACQAHGAGYKGRPAGSMGIAGCFSFYPGKNLGAYGEAGAVVTGDPGLADKIRMLRDHGQARRYHHAMIGWNGRMDGLQAAVLSVKLRYLPAWNDARRENSSIYGELLTGAEDVVRPKEMAYARHVYHIYALRTTARDALRVFLEGKGVSCMIHYPLPIHLQDAYRSLGFKEGDFPVAEKGSREELSLPVYPELGKHRLEYVASRIREFFR